MNMPERGNSSDMDARDIGARLRRGGGLARVEAPAQPYRTSFVPTRKGLLADAPSLFFWT